VLGWGSDPARLDEQLTAAGALLCQEMGLSAPVMAQTAGRGAA
jgi:hypothetical protein